MFNVIVSSKQKNNKKTKKGGKKHEIKDIFFKMIIKMPNKFNSLSEEEDTNKNNTKRVNKIKGK